VIAAAIVDKVLWGFPYASAPEEFTLKGVCCFIVFPYFLLPFGSPKGQHLFFVRA
jgi:hypothetical protein